MVTKRSSTPNLHIMSHEVRTPLNAITGLVSMLEDQHLSQETQQIVERLGINANALSQVLNTSIEVERIAQNRVVLAERVYSLQELVESCVRQYAAEAESRSVELTLQLDPKLIGKYFVGDPERLKQIFTALVSNAVKFTDEGSATLIVAIRKEKLHATQITVKVLDTGVGIPEVELESIFAAYYQIESAQKGRPTGTGSGLYIASNLLRLMNSELKVKSDTFGSEFGFTLDLTASDQGGLSWQTVSTTKRVRFVTPPSAQIELMSDLLKGLGIDVQRSTSLEQAASQPAADLTFIDYRAAGSELVLFREMVQHSDHKALCLLTSDFQPATALLGKGAQQWANPYLYSQLLNYCEAAGVVEKLIRSNTQENSSDGQLPSDLSNFTILCVDDSPTNLIVLIGALTKLGFGRVLKAKDGQDAVEVMRDHPEVDLVLMDFHMPRLNGAEAARAIRSGGSRAPIIGVTALSEADLESQIVDDDFDAVLTKPVNRQLLSETLGRWLSRTKR